VSEWIRRTKSGTHLVQISTDQVYDGPGPHPEEHVSLRNTYAFSKYCAEVAARAVSSTVLRTNFAGRSSSTRRRSFSDWIYDALCSRTPIQVVDDVRFSPLSIERLTNYIDVVATTRSQGTFNLGSRGGVSKAEFAFKFATALGMNTDVFTVIQQRMLQRRAYRPADMTMDSSRFESTFSATVPDVDDEIAAMASAYAQTV
jgi:dTDP-4-dehydrorhamnose reductase